MFDQIIFIQNLKQIFDHNPLPKSSNIVDGHRIYKKKWNYKSADQKNPPI